MPRPADTPFWGERLPLDDGGDLVGTANTNGAVNVYAAITYYGDGEYATLAVGDTIIAIASRSGTYLEPGDIVNFSWVIRCRGTATVAFRDDFDPSWDYSTPANDLGSQSVAYADFTELVIPTTNLNVASVLAYDGQRLTVEVTSGSLDIDQISLQVYPPGGAVGGYSAPLPAGTVEVPISSTTDANAIGYGADVGGAPIGFAASWATAVAALHAETADIITGDSHNVAGGTLFEALDNGSWFLEDHVQTYLVPFNNAIPDPVGVDGVDYIRRPDRTAYDADAYLTFDGVPLTVASWLNQAISVIRDPGSVDDGVFRIYRTDFNVLNPDDALDTDNVVLEDDARDLGAAPGLAQVTEFAMSFSTADTEWTYSLMSGWAVDSPGGTSWNTPSIGVGVRFFVGLSDFDTFWDPLTAVVNVPPYRLWVPAMVTKLRQNQRGDGLGRSPRRARGHQSRQASNRQRDYR
jgi:hypothetical protein